MQEKQMTARHRKEAHIVRIKLLYIFLFYVFIYAGNAVYGTFLPVYFQDIGFNAVQIGTLLSLGPFVALLAQPIWGTLSDRAKTKNYIVYIMLIGCMVALLLYPISVQYTYLLLMICLFTFFQTSIFALSDTITLEVLDRAQLQNFGIIRMGGTIGFAAMSLIFGLIARDHLGHLFSVYLAILIICLLLFTRFPVVAGHQSGGRKVSIIVLFRHRRLMLYMSFNFIVQITLGFYYAFFPMYFKELGGDTLLLGWSMVISSISEVPFLLFSNKIAQRVRVPVLLLVAGVASALRWYFFSILDGPMWVLPVQMLHGLIFIVLAVTMATYINREVPKELKASGQTFNGLLNLGVTRIIGSFFGGIAIAQFGLQEVFLFNSIATAVCVAIFGLLFWRLSPSRKAVVKIKSLSRLV